MTAHRHRPYRVGSAGVRGRLAITAWLTVLAEMAGAGSAGASAAPGRVAHPIAIAPPADRIFSESRVLGLAALRWRGADARLYLVRHGRTLSA